MFWHIKRFDGMQRRMISVVNVIAFLRLIFFYFLLLYICDLLHAADAIYGLP